MSDAILNALALLDPADDAHWNNDGSPKVDVTKTLGELESLSRAEIQAVAPDFNRETAAKAREEGGGEKPPSDSGAENSEGGDAGDSDALAPEDELAQVRLQMDVERQNMRDAQANLDRLIEREAELDAEIPSNKLTERERMDGIRQRTREAAERRQAEMLALRSIRGGHASPLDEAIAKKNQAQG